MKLKLLLLSVLAISSLTLSAQVSEMYGLAQYGGAYSGGTIFKIKTDGTGLSIAYNFQSPEGWNPRGSLWYASNGLFYGTCHEGGSWASCTIFSYDPSSGVCTDIYDFDIVNGDFPKSGVIETPGGNIWGVVPHGGAESAGVLYHLDMVTNAYTVKHSFGTISGANPAYPPVSVEGQYLYGAALGAGANFFGTIYRYDILTNTTTVVHDFAEAEGSFPWGSVIYDGSGKLYGMTEWGGANNSGVVYSYDIATDNYNVLHHFDGANGAQPRGNLTLVGDILYGLTTLGGATSDGVIFSYDLSTGTYTKLHDFDGLNGANPAAELFAAEDGKLYGTTLYGGMTNEGAIFSYDPATDTYTKMQDMMNTITGTNPLTGFVTASPMLSSQPGNYASEMQVFPNPATDATSLTFNVKKSGEATVKLYALSGALVHEISTEVHNGMNRIALPLQDMAAGMYTCITKTPDGSMTAKVVVQ